MVKGKRTTLLTIIGFLLVWNVTTLAQNSTSADSQCQTGRNTPGFRTWMWQAKSHVKVFTANGHFNQDEIDALRSAVNHWSDLAKATTSEVSFSYAGGVSAPSECTNCLTIIRRRISRPNHAAFFEAVGLLPSYQIVHATISLDPKVTNPGEISNAVAHEVGHSFGLLDCYSCRAHTTVMNAVNPSRGLNIPSACDVAQVKRAYEQLNQVLLREAKRRPPVDEGEEPEEDDTPVIDDEP